MDKLKTSWYPGHMARAFSVFKKEIKKAHVTIEVLDARIPLASRNKNIKTMSEIKNKIVILNKSDLVPPVVLKKWQDALSAKEGVRVISTNLATDKGSIQKLLAALAEARQDILDARTKGFAILNPILRIVVMGIPNVGKSTLINRLCGRSITRVGKKPGITLGQQWIAFGNNYELLDMPGILEPDLSNAETADKLSMTYAISDKVTDPYLVSLRLIDLLKGIYPSNRPNRAHPFFSEAVTGAPNSDEAIAVLARHFNFYLQSNTIDYHRTACKLLKDYRDGLMGKFILDDINKLVER